VVGERVVQTRQDGIEREDEEPDQPGRQEQQHPEDVLARPPTLGGRTRARLKGRPRPRDGVARRRRDRSSSYGAFCDCCRSVSVWVVAVCKPPCRSVVLPVCHSSPKLSK